MVEAQFAGPVRRTAAQPSDVLKSAEALFESKSVAEIREIEAATRRDIETKKQQLRQLVGDSYRDLIESADKIVAIAQNCNTILSNVVGIQDGFTALALSVSAANQAAPDKKDSLRKHEELQAIGSRVKYLVDTPEVIWGCLDSRQHLEAARRYLRAKEVHKLLRSQFGSDLLAKFPLLAHQWPLIAKFNKQITDNALSLLSSEQNLRMDLAADAIAAAACLQSSDSIAALQLLLDGRRAWMKAMLAAPCEDTSSLQLTGVIELLGSFAQVFQSCIAQVGELFLPSSKVVDGASLLQRVVQEDEVDSSELLFDGVPDLGASIREAEAWRATNIAAHDRLAALSSGQVEKACGQWMKEVAADCGPLCVALVGACGDASALCQAELALHNSITSWRHARMQLPGRSADEPRTKRSASMAAFASTGSLLDVSGGDSWEAVCEFVLGSVLDVWRQLFHQPFVERAKQIIQGCFEGVRLVSVPLHEYLTMAAAAPAEPVGQVACSQWPQVYSGYSGSLATPATAAPAPWHAAPRLSGVGVTAAAAAHGAVPRTLPRLPEEAIVRPTGFRQGVHHMRQHFDGALCAALQAALLMLDCPSGGPPAGPRPSVGSLSSSLPRRGSRPLHTGRGSAPLRATELEPFVVQQCSDTVMALAEDLQASLTPLLTPAEGMRGAPQVEQVLLLGRLCSAVAQESTWLPLALGPPDGWRAALAGGADASSRGAGTAGLPRTASGRPGALRGGAAQRCNAIVERFNRIASTAFQCWSQWAAGGLVSQLRGALMLDELLSSSATPLSWRETVVAVDGAGSTDLDGGLGAAGPLEMRFSLPACPSAAFVALLNGACREVKRAGDHTIGADALQIFEWELQVACVQCLMEVLTPPGGQLSARVSEKGVLQLLLDLRFTRDVLAGGRPHTRSATAMQPGSGTAAQAGSPMAGGGGGGGRLLHAADTETAALACMATQRQALAALEGELQGRLDPIDWATYESHLWVNAQRYLARVSMLYGTLAQLSRTSQELPQRAAGAGASADSNPLNLLPAAPRFQYLPVNTPSLGASTSGKAKLLLGAAALASAQRAASGELHNTYSFADLGSSARNAAAAAAGAGSGGSAAGGDQRGGEGAALAPSTFGALQAKLQAGSLGTLGSMFSDKAAEMTAMAQQRFEDFLPTSSIGSSLLSFTKSASKR